MSSGEPATAPPAPPAAAGLGDLLRELRDLAREHEDLHRAERRLAQQIAATYRRVLETRDREERGVDHHLDVGGAKRSPYRGLGEDELERRVLAVSGQGVRAIAATEILKTARETIRRHRLPVRRELEKLAKQLPVWPWVEGVRGFGAFGLAQIVAETTAWYDGELRHLSHYASPAKVWKRMGLGLVEDAQGPPQRQRKSADPLLAIRMGYVPRRRAVMFVIGDSLIMHNRDGVYRASYDERKAYERGRQPDLSAQAAHRRAHRYMEKKLLKHLWQRWRELTPTSSDLPRPISQSDQGLDRYSG